MTAYTPEPVPQTAGSPELQEYLMRELSRIGAALEIADTVNLPGLGIAPERPQEGTVIYADGVNFDPGGISGGGEGFYGYINGAWVKLSQQTSFSQSPAPMSVRGFHNGLEFGHSNAAGYGSMIGHFSSSGFPFIIFSGEHGTASNSVTTRGNRASVFRGDLVGGFVFQNVANANAADQTPVTIGALDNAGYFSGAGFKFPAAVTLAADPNTLDDFERGTWTPIYQMSGNNFSSVTYDAAQQSGVYVKIGRFVWFAFNLRTDAITLGIASGQVLVGGIPFSATFSYGSCNGYIGQFVAAPAQANLVADTHVYMYLAPGATGITSALGTTHMGLGANANELHMSGTMFV